MKLLRFLLVLAAMTGVMVAVVWTVARAQSPSTTHGLQSGRYQIIVNTVNGKTHMIDTATGRIWEYVNTEGKSLITPSFWTESYVADPSISSEKCRELWMKIMEAEMKSKSGTK